MNMLFLSPLGSPFLEVIKKCLGVVLRDLLKWRNTSDGWMVGVADVRGLFKPWWFCDSMIPSSSRYKLTNPHCCKGF